MTSRHLFDALDDDGAFVFIFSHDVNPVRRIWDLG
jgi:hypothetical protein